MYQLVSSLFLPPINFLIPFVLSSLLVFRYRKLSRWLLVFGFVFFYIQATPILPLLVLQGLEFEYPVLALNDPKLSIDADAIVVLGAGRYSNAPEYYQDTVKQNALERVRYAARIYRKTKLPILVSGGKPTGGTLSEGEAMREALVNDFAVPVKWVEERSINTKENAFFSREILFRQNIRKIVLITNASHMPRSVRTFESFGFKVVPAPMGFSTRKNQAMLASTMPKLASLEASFNAIHEWVGMLWYKIRPLKLQSEFNTESKPI